MSFQYFNGVRVASDLNCANLRPYSRGQWALHSDFSFVKGDDRWCVKLTVLGSEPMPWDPKASRLITVAKRSAEARPLLSHTSMRELKTTSFRFTIQQLMFVLIPSDLMKRTILFTVVKPLSVQRITTIHAFIHLFPATYTLDLCYTHQPAPGI